LISNDQGFFYVSILRHETPVVSVKREGGYGLLSYASKASAGTTGTKKASYARRVKSVRCSEVISARWTTSNLAS